MTIIHYLNYTTFNDLALLLFYPLLVSDIVRNIKHFKNKSLDFFRKVCSFANLIKRLTKDD